MNRARLTLVAVALLFLAPLVLAMLMRSGWWGFTPEQLSNRGTLVQPATQLPEDLTRPIGAGARDAGEDGRWTILYLLPANCGTACRESLAALRQVHLATGRDRERVTLWLLTDRALAGPERAALLNIYPGFELRADPDGRARQRLAGLSGKDGVAFGAAGGQAFVLDPASHIILRYAPGFDPRDLSQDLDRLLTWTPDE